MDGQSIRSALAAVGKRLPQAPIVEILIVGGAAALLSGQLGGAYTTGDVDVLIVLPPQKWDQVQDIAAEVGRVMGLPANWVNRDAGLFIESLPEEWEARRFHVGKFGGLEVWTVGRLDLIAMKFYSHRDRDIDHLHGMKVTSEELKFVRQFLNSQDDPANAGRIAMALSIAESWKTQ